jgi:hypothetical protein
LFIDSSGRVTGQGFSSYRGNSFTTASFAANTTIAPLNIVQGNNGTHPSISAGQNSTGTYANLGLLTSDLYRLLISPTGTSTFTADASTAPVVVNIGASEVARIDSSGRLGLGTSSPQETLDVNGNASTTSSTTLNGTALRSFIFRNSEGVTAQVMASIQAFNDATAGPTASMGGHLALRTTTRGDASPTTRMFISSAGLVGIGTNSVQAILHASKAGAEGFEFNPGYEANRNLTFHYNRTGSNYVINDQAASQHVFRIGSISTEAVRIDANSRLLVGTSSSVSVASLEANQQIFGSAPQLSIIRGSNNASGATLALAKSRNTAIGSRTIVSAGDTMGSIRFCGDDGVNLDAIGAQIAGQVDGTPGAGDLPSRLVFSTTADGASSPTERMRITSSGQLLVGTSSAVNNADLQAANSISVGGTIKREVSKSLNLADNTSTTLFTFQIPGGGSQSHRTYVGGEISYIVAVGRETSLRNSRTTYGKVYFSIDRFWESNANNPVSVNLIDTDKSLSTSNGSAPTITWAITTDAGIDNAAKNVYLAITVDNPFVNSIQTNITGTISYHTLSFSDVTLS